MEKAIQSNPPWKFMISIVRNNGKLEPMYNGNILPPDLTGSLLVTAITTRCTLESKKDIQMLIDFLTTAKHSFPEETKPNQ